MAQPHDTPGPTTGTAAIIGGGISGLAASIALRRAGWSMSIYERSQFKNEIGAGITVPPNAALVLKHFGFDFERAQSVPNQTIRMARADTLEYFLVEEYPGLSDEVSFGQGSWSFHRVDLHRGLRELAVSEDGEGKPVEMNLGCEVVELDCEKGVLTLVDGRTVKKDLVVLADGAHVSLISYTQPHQRTLYHPGQGTIKSQPN